MGYAQYAGDVPEILHPLGSAPYMDDAAGFDPGYSGLGFQVCVLGELGVKSLLHDGRSHGKTLFQIPPAVTHIGKHVALFINQGSVGL